MIEDEWSKNDLTLLNSNQFKTKAYLISDAKTISFSNSFLLIHSHSHPHKMCYCYVVKKCLLHCSICECEIFQFSCYVPDNTLFEHHVIRGSATVIPIPLVLRETKGEAVGMKTKQPLHIHYQTNQILSLSNYNAITQTHTQVFISRVLTRKHSSCARKKQANIFSFQQGTSHHAALHMRHLLTPPQPVENVNSFGQSSSCVEITAFMPSQLWYSTLNVFVNSS